MKPFASGVSLGTHKVVTSILVSTAYSSREAEEAGYCIPRRCKDEQGLSSCPKTSLAEPCSQDKRVLGTATEANE